MSQTENPKTAFSDHNHGLCCGSVMKTADKLVQDTGLSLTPVRRRTLEILLEEHRAIGAYEVLERLASDGFGKQPPVAYRALEFLVTNGLAHRIRRLNGFTACMAPGQDHDPVFFICSTCNAVAEAPGAGVGHALNKAADNIGFKIDRSNVETVGTCPSCQKAANL